MQSFTNCLPAQSRATRSRSDLVAVSDSEQTAAEKAGVPIAVKASLRPYKSPLTSMSIEVNGHVLLSATHAVHKLDLRSKAHAFKPGENTIEITVINQWTNRLIGDRTLPEAKKILGNSGVTVGGFGANAMPAPPESGLIGPVTLERFQ